MMERRQDDRRAQERRQQERRISHLHLVGQSRASVAAADTLDFSPAKLIEALQETIEVQRKVELAAEELWSHEDYSEATHDTLKRAWGHARSAEMQARLDLADISRDMDRRRSERRNLERRGGDRRDAPAAG